MAERAQVRSVEAIAAFRSQLIVYVGRARPLLEEVSADLQRMRLWLEIEQRHHLEQQVRKRARDLEAAQQSLFSARLSTLREVTAFEQANVHKARQALSEAEERLRAVKRWAREFDSRTEFLTKQLDAVETYFAHDMARAIAWLTEVVRQLDAYANLETPGVWSTPASDGAPPGDAVAVPPVKSVPDSKPEVDR